LKKISSLDISNKGVKDLTGINNLVNLGLLQAHNNEISDISPLAGTYKNLQFVFLNNNQISDLSSVSGLIQSMAAESVNPNDCAQIHVNGNPVNCQYISENSLSWIEDNGVCIMGGCV